MKRKSVWIVISVELKQEYSEEQAPEILEKFSKMPFEFKDKEGLIADAWIADCDTCSP